MFPLMYDGRGPDAIQLMCSVFGDCMVKSRTPAGTVTLVFEGMWEICTYIGTSYGPDTSATATSATATDWRRLFITNARDMFYGLDSEQQHAPARGDCMARRNIMACAVVVANSLVANPNATVPVPRTTWDPSRADNALRQAMQTIDVLFSDQRMTTMQMQVHVHPPSSVQVQQMNKGPFSYLNCYTRPSAETAADVRQEIAGRTARDPETNQKIIVLTSSPPRGESRSKQRSAATPGSVYST